MHNLVFGLKRLHQTAQRYATNALRFYGLTPARFDVLQVVGSSGMIMQSDLRRMLGVARSTLSKMLTSMERRGLVRRWSVAPQRTPKSVSLTERARELFLRVYALARPAASAVVGEAFAIPPNGFMRYSGVMIVVDDLLDNLRRRVGDRASLQRVYDDFLRDH
jgi:DNA-binding MarR family transcriptional regulator